MNNTHTENAQSPLNLVAIFVGESWAAAALRALVVFLFGYLLLPMLLGRHGNGVPFLQFSASALAFLLGATAIFRLLVVLTERRRDAKAGLIPATSLRKAMLADVEWSSEMLRGLPQTRLEMVAAAIYREKGIRLDAYPQPAWGGVVLRLFQEEGDEPTSLVRCKACDGHAIERRQVEELLRAMVAEAIPKAFFLAPDGFSEEAIRLARSAHITPIDGAVMLAMLNRLHDEARHRVYELAFSPVVVNGQ